MNFNPQKVCKKCNGDGFVTLPRDQNGNINDITCSACDGSGFAASPQPLGLDIDKMAKDYSGKIKDTGMLLKRVIIADAFKAGYAASQNNPDSKLVYTGVMDNNGVKEYVKEYDPPQSSTEEEKECNCGAKNIKWDKVEIPVDDLNGSVAYIQFKYCATCGWRGYVDWYD